MRKQIKTMLLIALALIISSCGTLYGGKITACQKTKPLPGQMQREIRPVALIADILFLPAISLTVDFATGNIYKPCKK